jgi:pimeloyl-ACP methyl ester carboxylesterase
MTTTSTTEQTVRVAGREIFLPSGPLAPLTLWRMDFTRDSRLSKLETPTLVVWGAEDKVNRPDGGLTLAKTMPNCDLLLVSKAGHWVQWERADLFNSTVTNFLSGGRS